MADYRVELLVDGPLDAHTWEFAHGAYPKLSKKGTVVQLTVDADSAAQAMAKGEASIEAEYSALNGKVKATRACRPTSTAKYLKRKRGAL